MSAKIWTGRVTDIDFTGRKPKVIITADDPDEIDAALNGGEQ